MVSYAVDGVLVGLFVLFYVIGDTATTVYGMKKYHEADVESVRQLFEEQFGVTESLSLKVVQTALLLAVFYAFRVRWTEYALIWWSFVIYGVGAGVYATAGNYWDIRAERAPES